MQTISRLLRWMAALRMPRKMATASYTETATPDPTGDVNSELPWPKETVLLRKPSIEHSAMSSTASITLRVSPDPPLVYTVEPESGHWPWHRLTVRYVPLLEDLGFPTPKFDGSDSSMPTFEEVDDPKWLDYVESLRSQH